MTERAAGYKRLSQDGGASLERQDRLIRAYADDNDMEIVAMYNDGEYQSGYENQREQYQQLLTDAEAGEFDVVIVDDGSRLGREMKERVRTFYNLDDYGVEFHAAQYGYVDPNEPMEVLMEVFRAATDQQAKQVEIEKAREVVEHRLDQGCFQGQPPFGLQFAADKCHLERDDAEWELCEAVWAADAPTTVDIPKSTAWRVAERGREWYEARLEEYGRAEVPQ